MQFNPNYDPRRLRPGAVVSAAAVAAPFQEPRTTYVRPLLHRVRTSASGFRLRVQERVAPVLAALHAMTAPALDAVFAVAGLALARAGERAPRLLRALWFRFGFVPSIASAVALLTFFGASMVGYAAAGTLALETGKWSFVLASASGMLILARKQIRRAVRW